MSARGRRFVVMVRAGDKSLHRSWLQGGERNWDLVVSWFGEAPYTPVADERVLPAKGWKWDVLGRQLLKHGEIVERYDYFLLADDDVEMDAARISRLFEMTEQHGLAVSQPGLTPDSYFSHAHTIVSPSFRLRYTDFVEIMVPVLSRATLRQTLPLMAGTPSGFGLDSVWNRFEPDNRHRAAIIDAVAVRHTRPIGRVLRVSLADAGRTPEEEGRVVTARFGVRLGRRNFPVYGGIRRNGRVVGKGWAAIHMLMDYLLAAPRYIQPRGFKRTARMFLRVNRPAALSQVAERAPAPRREMA